ncbi:MAG: hypothetical protein HQL50_00570 [Magnetococcales bacterium]|nr:hypothetical protein [Magnetococcales bacterium]
MKFLLNSKFLYIPTISAFTTWCCLAYDFVFEMGIAGNVAFGGIFFTFAITIGTANRRRFEAFDEISELKSNVMSLADVYQRILPDRILPVVMDDLRTFFPMLQSVLSEQKSTIKLETLLITDRFFQNQLQTIFTLKQHGLKDPELACVMQWHQRMRMSMERLISIKEHTTPVTLRRFVYYALLVTVIIMSPEFADMEWFGVITAFLLTFMVVVLVTIQEMIEDPFGKAMDDVRFEFIGRIQERLIRRDE